MEFINFTFDPTGSKVRSVTFPNGVTWFALCDILSATGYSRKNTYQVCRVYLDQSDYGKCTFPGKGGSEITIIKATSVNKLRGVGHGMQRSLIFDWIDDLERDGLIVTTTETKAKVIPIRPESPSQPEAVTPFVFPVTGAAVRVTAQDGEPWFVAKDVCDVLGLEARDSVRYLDDDEKSYVSRKHIGLAPGKDALIINESGLYSLILKSRKPEAKAFKKWVTRDVLPAIRKDGMYIMGEEKVKTGEMSGEELLSRAILFASEKIERLTKEIAIVAAERDDLQEIVTANIDYVTVDSWRALRGLYMTPGEKTKLGKTATKLAEKNGLSLEKQERFLPGPYGGRMVKVNVYPAEFLDKVAEFIGLLARKVI